MAFRDLSEVLDAGLSLPVNGKTYVVPPVDAETGLRLQRLAELAAQTAKAVEDGEPLDEIVLDDAGEVDLYRDALGAAYEQMITDRVPWPALKIARVTAWLDAAVGRDGRGVLERSRRPGTLGRESGDPPSGPIDPATGLREWYDPHPQDGHTWTEILEHWQLIESDLHDTFGVDIESGILRHRSWRWLRTRIVRLLCSDSRLARVLAPREHRGFRS